MVDFPDLRRCVHLCETHTLLVFRYRQPLTLRCLKHVAVVLTVLGVTLRWNSICLPMLVRVLVIETMLLNLRLRTLCLTPGTECLA